ncbi:MAG: inner membrane protein YpjD [Desulfovibrionales bacterium]
MGFLDLLSLSIILLYFSGTLVYLGGVLGQKAFLQRAALILTVLGFGLHTLDLFINLAGPGNTLYQGKFYFSLLAWTLLLIYLLMAWRLKTQFLALTAAPLALILFSSSLTVSTEQLAIPPLLSLLWFGLHIGTLFAAIALLGTAFGAGVAYLYLDKKIKNKSKLLGWTSQIPSLTSFDRVNHFAVSIGFPLYTLGLLSGFIWAKLTWKTVFTWDPKEVATLAIWFCFAYLFYQRVGLGWKGRKPAKLAIWVFVLTLISLVGINFLLPTHHSFRP